MDYGNITRRDDGSYVINNGMYHVIQSEAALFSDVDAYAQNNPDRVTRYNMAMPVQPGMSGGGELTPWPEQPMEPAIQK